MKPRFRNAQHAGLALGFRSGLEEVNAKHIEANGEPVLFETFKVRYVIPASVHTYTCDWRLRNGILVETKGRFLMSDRAKHLFIHMQYPELDIRFVFSRLKTPISPGAKTTCQQWCEKYGFKFAEKLIPVSWFKEEGPVCAPEKALSLGPIGFRDLVAKEKKAR